MKVIIMTITATLVFTIHIPGRAQQLEYFTHMALKHSPVLKASVHNSRFARSNYNKESMFKKNPVVNFGYTNVPVTEWPSLDKHAMSGVSIGISQFIAFPWEDHYRKKVFEQKYLSAKETLEQAKNLLNFQVATTYHTIQFLYTKKLILLENKSVLKNILKLSESLVATNRMASSQLLKIRADIAVIENNIIKLNGKIDQSRAAMENICGTNLKWEFNKKQIKQWIDTKYNSSFPKRYNFSKHPLYKKVHALYQAKIAARKLENAKTFPGVNIGVEYRFRQEIPGKDMGEDFISLKASMPIPLFYASKERHSINAAKHKEQQLKQDLRAIKLDLVAKWKGETDNHKQLLLAFRNFNQKILPGYYSVYQAQIASLATGTIKLIDVLDSYQKYLKATLERARLFKELAVSRQKIVYLLHNQSVFTNDKYKGVKK